MKKVDKILLGVLFISIIVVSIIIFSSYSKNVYVPQNNYQEQAVKLVLRDLGYNVIDAGYDKSEDYVYVSMYSTNEPILQTYAGFGALKGAYPDDNYYIITLAGEGNICSFGVSNIALDNYLDGRLSEIQFFLSIESICD